MQRSRPALRIPVCCFGPALFAVFSVLRCSTVYGDGAMFTITPVGHSAAMVESPRQEALVVLTGGTVQVTLRTSFRTGPKDLAWIIPVPHPPERVEVADDDLFNRLEKWTAPSFFVKRQVGVHIGCGRSADSTQPIGRVVVTQTGKAGIFDYTVLTATGVDVLTRWLRQHNYSIPEGAEAVFKRYVDQRWCWLAVRLNVTAVDKSVLAPRPIRYTYHDNRCVYPLVISQLSAEDENEVVLYVLADSSYGCENWANCTMHDEDVMVDRRSPSGTNYEELFGELTVHAGGHLFVAESVINARLFKPPQRTDFFGRLFGKEMKEFWSSEDSAAFYLTRLRAVVPRADLDRDVALTPRVYFSRRHPYEFLENSLRVSTDEGGGWGFYLALVIIVALVLAIVSRRVFLSARKRQMRTIKGAPIIAAEAVKDDGV